jgi:preprotein translocase subunit SecA
LHIIGTERHESRRVDNQLRGRAGRQGDPGSSRFYLSLEDTLLRIFASDRVAAIMDRLKMPEGEAIEHPWVTRAIENAQRKVEARNFDMRKQLLEYDDVANDQRKAIYEKRNELMESEDITDSITGIREQVLESLFHQYVPPDTVAEQWDVAGLEKNLAAELSLDLPLQQWLDENERLDAEGLLKKMIAAANAQYRDKVAAVGAEGMHHFERGIMLQSLDTHWREHLSALDHLRQGIHLRGYAQKNPKQEYKRESFELFSSMLDTIWYEVTRVTLTVQIRSPEDVEVVDAHIAPENIQYHHADYEEVIDASETESTPADAPAPFVRHDDKVGRNDACPCGSGKKYKHCHGRLA